MLDKEKFKTYENQVNQFLVLFPGIQVKKFHFCYASL